MTLPPQDKLAHFAVGVLIYAAAHFVSPIIGLAAVAYVAPVFKAMANVAA